MPGPPPKFTDLDMTKHSDYFVWKDTSECVARCCDDTVDKQRVNSCVLKHLVLEGFEQSKYRQRNPEMLSLRRTSNVTFSQFRGWRRQKKNRVH